MEKQKKKMTESVFKAIVYTFLIYFLAIAEIGILSGFRFVSIEGVGRNGSDIGLTGSTKGYAFAQIGAEIGWQFVVMSVALFVGVLIFCFWMGFHRQPAGMATVVVVNLLPLLGLLFPAVAVYDDIKKAWVGNGWFSFLWGYGTAGMIPMMSLFGLHLSDDPLNRTAPAIFMIIFAVLAIIAWFAGKAYRRAYAEKYEFDLSVPLV